MDLGVAKRKDKSTRWTRVLSRQPWKWTHQSERTGFDIYFFFFFSRAITVIRELSCLACSERAHAAFNPGMHGGNKRRDHFLSHALLLNKKDLFNHGKQATIFTCLLKIHKNVLTNMYFTMQRVLNTFNQVSGLANNHCPNRPRDRICVLSSAISCFMNGFSFFSLSSLATSLWWHLMARHW